MIEVSNNFETLKRNFNFEIEDSLVFKLTERDPMILTSDLKYNISQYRVKSY